MLALASTHLPPDAKLLLERGRTWEFRQVSSIREAIAAMSPDDRASVRAVFVEAEPIGESVLSLLDNLEIITCLRSEPVNIDIEAASAHDVVVLHTPGRNAEAVADFTLGLCLAMLRNIAVSHHAILSGELTTAHPVVGVERAKGDIIWRPDDPQAQAELAELLELHLALGAEGILLIDAGTVFSENVAAAAERLQALSEAEVHWFEEPFHNYALDAYGALAKTSPRVALAGGEGSHNAHQAVQMMRQGGVRFIQVDTGRIGGITAAKQVADEAVALGVTYVNHTFTSGLALAASLVPFAGLEDHLICEYPVEPKSLARELAGNPFPLDSEGMIALNEAPGLGVEVDVDALQKYLVPVEIRVGGKLIYETQNLK